MAVAAADGPARRSYLYQTHKYTDWLGTRSQVLPEVDRTGTVRNATQVAPWVALEPCLRIFRWKPPPALTPLVRHALAGGARGRRRRRSSPSSLFCA